MAYWLLKTEPGTYPWEQLVRDGRTHWDGVRNYLARNHLRDMREGDRAFLYHSVGPRLIVGTARVVREAYPDPTTPDPAWVCVDIVPEHPLPRPVSLDEVKANPSLQEMALIKLSRLSVQPVREEEWHEVLRMAEHPHENPAALLRMANKKAPPKPPSTRSARPGPAPGAPRHVP